jgi:hypothetical protein
VNDLFPKTPSRIDPLGMILIIALIVWRIMERSMRLYLKQTKSTVLGWDNKPTSRPKSYMVTQVFFGIQVILFKDQQFSIKEPTNRQFAFLSALGLVIDRANMYQA